MAQQWHSAAQKTLNEVEMEMQMELRLRLTDGLTEADTRWPHKMQHAKGAQLTAAKDKHKRFHCPPSLSHSLSPK